MGGAHYIWIECSCGHTSKTFLNDWPEHQRGEGHLKPEVLARLRCSKCRRKPTATISGWKSIADDFSGVFD